MKFDAAKWHADVKALYENDDGYKSWRAAKKENVRVIPLCTPIPRYVEVIVIGINHAAFDDDPIQAEKIAEEFSLAVPKVSTFLAYDQNYAGEFRHDHNYAQKLRKATKGAGLKINEKWVGTNRIPVQWPDWSGILRSEWSKRLLPKMNDLLIELVKKTDPKYVITCGSFPAELHYGKRFPTPEAFGSGTRSIVVPLWHPATRKHGGFHNLSVPVLREHVKLPIKLKKRCG